jgi:hypothetical protein
MKKEREKDPTEASKSKFEKVQTTDSETIDTVKLYGCCVYEEAVVLLNTGQKEIARAPLLETRRQLLLLSLA